MSKAQIIVWGFDEYGRTLHEVVEVNLDTFEPSYTKQKYAYLGHIFDEEWYTKIGEWFWK